MKSQVAQESLWDMERIARVFTWLAGALMLFVLGMVFSSAIFADTLSPSTSSTTTTPSTTTTK